jgi:hypothetical protein
VTREDVPAHEESSGNVFAGLGLPGAEEGIDWRQVDATTEEDIARQIAEDPDAATDMAGWLRGGLYPAHRRPYSWLGSHVARSGKTTTTAMVTSCMMMKGTTPRYICLSVMLGGAMARR